VDDDIVQLQACREEVAGDDVGNPAHDQVSHVMILVAEASQLGSIQADHANAGHGPGGRGPLVNKLGHAGPPDHIQGFGLEKSGRPMTWNAGNQLDLALKDNIQVICPVSFCKKDIPRIQDLQTRDLDEPIQVLWLQFQEPGYALNGFDQVSLFEHNILYSIINPNFVFIIQHEDG
jgi:hypothetical protein